MKRIAWALLILALSCVSFPHWSSAQLQPNYRLPVSKSEFLDSLAAWNGKLTARDSSLADSLYGLRGEMGDSALAALADSLFQLHAMDDSLGNEIEAVNAELDSLGAAAMAKNLGQDSICDSLKTASALKDSILQAGHDSLTTASANKDSTLQVQINALTPEGQAGVADTARKALALAQKDSAEIKVLDSRVDAGNSFYRVSADTTSPGMFYYLGPDNQMHRADGTTATKAIAAATDSVNKGSVCRFQYTGALALTRWQGLWAPGTALVNDSLTAGGVSALDTLRSAAKKMQNYATAGDSSKGEIILNIEPTFWTWGN